MPTPSLIYCPLCLGWQVDFAPEAVADLDDVERAALVDTLVRAHLGECPEVLAFLGRGGADRDPARPLKARAASTVAGLLAKAVERVERLAA